VPARLNPVRTGKQLLKPDKYKNIIVKAWAYLVRKASGAAQN